ncbi:AGC family protein kinase [Trichomonas vaginalis G3]|uniref:AGC family protein kinase n=1 Tax=Trichomonas vaginalis (strain ATCC PRA-98 / G3) TaxID=412133 RepID=A2F3S2_TRIV3|nr:protein serine/threonine kinase protein [Trichomonas vaginalis G3]EAY00444.1 AGC family protein kinase [Trichomonas vaginalis G3]KAI5493478.1 protein serine/threonine kinase protein [Trichomonas vaginalis G3]|eukprot:XP_001313373.1 AGC family protein kinase [Trichomonas vaginalis G3]
MIAFTLILVYYYLEKNKVSYAEKLVWIYFIADQLETLHKNKIVHRDICPKNIRIDTKHFPHIIDYDDVQKSGNPMATSHPHGTGLYQSPEVIKNLVYSPSSDIFALGGVIYYIMTENEPNQAVKAIIKSNRIELDQVKSVLKNVDHILQNLDKPVKETEKDIEEIISLVSR